MTEHEQKVIEAAIVAVASMTDSDWYGGHVYEQLKSAVEEYVSSLEVKPCPCGECGDIPKAVRWAIVKRFSNDAKLYKDILRNRITLNHMAGCYMFEWQGMAVGVEMDGYLHT